jgi:hypothetical protein
MCHRHTTPWPASLPRQGWILHRLLQTEVQAKIVDQQNECSVERHGRMAKIDSGNASLEEGHEQTTAEYGDKISQRLCPKASRRWR